MTGLLASILLFLLSVTTLSAQNESINVQNDSINVQNDSIHCIPVHSLDQENIAFQPGERYRYTMHYTWGNLSSDIGSATVSLDTVRVDGIPAYQVLVYGKTARFYDIFFKVREDFRSWFTIDGLVPLRFSRDSKEGKYHATNHYVYHWDAPEPYIDADLYTTRRGDYHEDVPLKPCTFDLPALYYYARNMDFSKVIPGQRYPMTFVLDEDVCDVYFIMYGREKKKVKGLGTVNCIKFAAKLLAGTVFTGEEDLMIWVSDDENRIPVYFEAPLLVGHASGRLASATGTKYPLIIE